MSSTMVANKINWADDDEDDFDFEAWKATADISAPTIESLPPLQLPTSEAEPVFTTASSATAEVAPWAVSELHHVATPIHNLETTDWRCGKPMLVWRAMQETPQLPAYPGMSAWDNGVISPGYRVQYSSNWKRWKVNVRADCRFTALLCGSKLREVEMCEEEELEILHEKVVDLAPDGVELDELETIFPLHNETTSQDALDAHTTTTADVPETSHILDEGYYSDESCLTSPTSPTFAKDFNAPSCATCVGPCVGLSPATKFINHRRHNSQDALKEVAVHHHDTIDDEVAIEDVQVAPSVVQAGENDGLPDVIDDVPGFAPFDINEQMFRMMANGWYYLWKSPWKTAAVITTGIVLGGTVHMMRKR